MAGPGSSLLGAGEATGEAEPDRVSGNGEGESEGGSSGAPSRRRWAAGAEVAAGLLVTLTYLLVHPVHTALTAPLWDDENWVAVSLKAPWHQLPLVSASTPLLWTALLRLVPHWGSVSRLRALPIAFGMAEVGSAFLVGRRFARATWKRIAYGWAVAAVVLLCPFALGRNDLKQYTADAFVSVLAVLLVLRLEERWTRGRLATLAVLAGPGVFLSDLAPVVGAAALAGVGIVALARRRFRRCAEVALWTIAAVIVAGLWLFHFNPRPPGLHQYWASKGYFPHSLGSFVAHRLQELTVNFNLATWWMPLVVIVGSALGLALVLRRPAAGLFFPLVLGLALALGRTGRYPLFDLRTSAFLWAAWALATGLAVVELAELAGRWWRPAAVVVCGGAVALYALGALPFVDSWHVPFRNMGAEIRFMDAHLRPGDVILSDVSATVDLALYSDVHAAFVRAPDPMWALGWIVTFPDQPRIVAATSLAPAIERRALTRACSLARASRGRVWLLRDYPRTQRLWLELAGGSTQLLSYRPADPYQMPNRTIPLVLMRCPGKGP